MLRLCSICDKKIILSFKEMPSQVPEETGESLSKGLLIAASTVSIVIVVVFVALILQRKRSTNKSPMQYESVQGEYSREDNQIKQQ